MLSWRRIMSTKTDIKKRSIMRDAEAISRRALLGGAALAVSAVAASISPAAEQKVSQADAKYQDQPKGQQRCEICLQFQPPNTCRIVEGPIGREGWCQYFAAKENAH
jgi:hypothetical protein